MCIRIVLHDNERKPSRVGAAKAIGRCLPQLGLYATGSSEFLRRPYAKRPTLGASVSGRRNGRFEGQAASGTAAQAFRFARAASSAMVSPLAPRVQFSHRSLERAARDQIDSTQVWQRVSSALYQSVAGRTPRHAAEAGAAGPRTRRASRAELASQGVAANKKIAKRRRAHIVLIDESGFLMSPLVRRTLAPRGKTPILKTKASHREKVSVTAALTISPKSHRLGLYWKTFPRSFVNAERSAEFLRGLLRNLDGAVIVVWDGGPMHKGEPIQKLCSDYPRLHLERLPPYAPDLNPVEYLWSHLKYGRMANFIPDDVFQLDAVLNDNLRKTRKSPQSLSAFFRAAKLPFL